MRQQKRTEARAEGIERREQSLATSVYKEVAILSNEFDQIAQSSEAQAVFPLLDRAAGHIRLLGRFGCAPVNLHLVRLHNKGQPMPDVRCEWNIRTQLSCRSRR